MHASYHQTPNTPGQAPGQSVKYQNINNQNQFHAKNLSSSNNSYQQVASSKYPGGSKIMSASRHGASYMNNNIKKYSKTNI